MLSRVALFLIKLFWATMNVLLWLLEFCGYSQKLDRSMAARVVLEKIRRH